MEVHIHPFQLYSVVKKQLIPKFLHTSPEFCLKRLLASPEEKIDKLFSMSYCFRDEPDSPVHRSQFLMLEWYRKNERYEKIMQDVEELISASGFSVACAGRDDHLDIYLSNGDFAIGRQIKEKLVAELKVAPGAVRVLGISEIPRGESGKIQYSLLEMLSSQTLA
jgi:elongation factor P--beta-lysine ligase